MQQLTRRSKSWLQETVRRIRDYEKLYDLVKNQRNKFVNLIQARGLSGWGLALLKDLVHLLLLGLGILC